MAIFTSILRFLCVRNIVYKLLKILSKKSRAQEDPQVRPSNQSGDVEWRAVPHVLHSQRRDQGICVPQRGRYVLPDDTVDLLPDELLTLGEQRAVGGGAMEHGLMELGHEAQTQRVAQTPQRDEKGLKPLAEEGELQYIRPFSAQRL